MRGIWPLLALLACGPRRIAAPPPLVAARPAPATTPMQVCWLEFGRMTARGGVATAGRTHTRTLDGTLSGALIRHPAGTLLLDTGNSSAFADELRNYRGLKRTFLKRGPGSATRLATAPDALAAVGQRPQDLSAVLLSHAHVDHAGGLRDLPEVPVWMPTTELDYVRAHADGRTVGVVREHAERMIGHTTPFDFPSGPYEGFDRSWDVFGDGAVVLVPLPGHTPGSIGTFVNLSPTRRLLHIGDVALIHEGVHRLRHKGFLMRAFTDDDPRGVGQALATLHALDQARPELTLIPAHDRTAWAAFFDQPGCTTP